jgi:Na+-translocating ferredoxin:NAD+ oxidoreductase RnfC subunit
MLYFILKANSFESNLFLDHFKMLKQILDVRKLVDIFENITIFYF